MFYFWFIFFTDNFFLCSAKIVCFTHQTYLFYYQSYMNALSLWMELKQKQICYKNMSIIYLQKQENIQN